jgi:prepilin-type processing-associated H-X9-DG protein
LIEVLIVIGVLSVLLGLLLPAFAAARANGRAVDCRSKLHQITLALRMYGDDYDGICPPSQQWDRLLIQRLRVPPPYSCPALQNYRFNPRARPLPGETMAGYAINSYLVGMPIRTRVWREHPARVDPVPFPATTVAFFDARIGMVSTARPDVGDLGGLAEGATRHRGGANYSFLDGHVKWYRPEQVVGSSRQPPDGTRPSFRPN